MILQHLNFYLTLEVAMTDVTSGCQLLFSQAITHLKQECFQILTTNPSNMDDLVEPQYKLNKFCADHFNFVVCK